MDSSQGGRPTRVQIVGLGVIGRVHLKVLTALPAVVVDATVDPGGAGEDSPSAPAAFSTLGEALADGPPPDLVVVATPTDSHLDVVSQALAMTAATVLSEKPLSRDLDALRAFAQEERHRLNRVRVVNHFAFAPEVVWAVRQVQERGWPVPHRFVSTFTDPYILKSAQQRTSYVSSWVDSGANQLAVLSCFAEGLAVQEHRGGDDGMWAVTEVRYDGGRATLVSDWRTGASSKQTSLRWQDGSELFLDHTAMTGYVSVADRVDELLGNDGSTDRKVAHYTPMYQALLSGAGEALLGLPLARRISVLLAAA